MKGRPLKMSIKARKQAAWDAISLYIRQKYAGEDGLCICYTCGKVHHYKDMDAGHGINGRNNAVLFMEEVIKPQCTHCNRYLNGNYKAFIVKLIAELGVERYQELLAESNKVKKMTPQEFLDIQRLYESKLEELDK